MNGVSGEDVVDELLKKTLVHAFLQRNLGKKATTITVTMAKTTKRTTATTTTTT